MIFILYLIKMCYNMDKEKVIYMEYKITSNSEQDTIVVASILDDYFVFGKKNKDKIVNAIKEKYLDDKKLIRSFKSSSSSI